MTKISSDLKKVIKKFLQDFPFLTLEEGGKHVKIRNTQSKDFIPLPTNPGCQRGMNNIINSLTKLARTGQGFIFSRTSKDVSPVIEIL